MQTVKTFIYGRDRLSSVYNPETLEDQINGFLGEHPDYTIASISTIVGAGFQEAFVVFDIPEEKPAQDERKREQTQGQAQNQNQNQAQKFNRKDHGRNQS